MTRVLHHELLSAEGSRPVKWLLMLHGIFGTGRNWSHVGRALVQERPDWGVVLVDLPEHGRSTGVGVEATLEGAAEGLHRLVERESFEAAGVLGHSFGGKVALRYAEAAEGLEQVWVADSSPDPAPPSCTDPVAPTGQGWWMLKIVRELPGPFADRNKAVAALVGAGVSEPVAKWMAMNLKRKRDGQELVWRFDLERMESLLRDYYAADLWDVVECDTNGLRVDFIKADQSDVLDDAACARIRQAAANNSRIHLHHVPGGHWINAENPDAIVDLLTDRLVVC